MKTFDIIIITPDAYVDHPSFASAMLKHNLCKKGFSVAIVDRPKWQEKDYFKFGKPSLFWAVSGGNVDSLIMNYTPTMRKRKTDAYQIDGNPYFSDLPSGEKSRIRADRCITVYVNGIKSIDKKTPIIIGGIEASMRRFAYYDFLSNRIRSSILIDSNADLLVYGMGEKLICEIARLLKEGEKINQIKLRGTLRVLNKNEDIEGIDLPDFESVREDKESFLKMTEIIYENLNPFTAKALKQKYGVKTIVQFPPQFPLTEKEMDDIFDSDFDYGYNEKKIPAARMIRDSIITHRGCFGGCSFCSLSLHQGKYIQSRSLDSIKKEIIKRSKLKGFNKTITDLGGPTANMYKMECVNKNCNRLSCISPDICKNINFSNHPAKKLYKEILNLKDKNGRKILKNLFISSGIRYDIALYDREYIDILISNCLSGQIKIAPEHCSKNVLKLMNKTENNKLIDFIKIFKNLNKKTNKKQKIIPYLMIGHPGETFKDVLELKDFLKKHNLVVKEVQIFTPLPMTLSTAAYYTGIMPFTREKIEVCKDLKELQRRKEIILKK